MSPHTVNNFVSDLVLMAQAVEKLPLVERELEEARRTASDWIKTCENVQADLAQSRHYAAELEQKVHNLEVARDDAELAFLEADERTSRALDFIKATFGNAGTLIQALEPARPAPQADSPSLSEPISIESIAAQLDSHPVSEHSGERVSHPTTATLATPLSGVGSQTADASIAGEACQRVTDPMLNASTGASAGNISASSTVDASQMGQREPDPTSATTQNVSEANHTPVPSVTLSEPVGAIEPPAPGPYHNRRYHDIPTFISEEAWTAGGGTLDDYHWRPERANRY